MLFRSNAWGRLYDNITGSLDARLELSDGRVETMGLAGAARILYSGDSERREPAWRAIRAQMSDHREAIAAVLNALAGWRLGENRQRSSTRSIHFLDPSVHQSRIDRSTLDCLMAVTWEHVDIGRKAGCLMARTFGTDALAPWDQLAPMPPAVGSRDRTYSFAEAIALIGE